MLAGQSRARTFVAIGVGKAGPVGGVPPYRAPFTTFGTGPMSAWWVASGGGCPRVRLR